MSYFIYPGLPKSEKTPLSLEEKIDLLYVKVSREFNTTKEAINSESRIANVAEARAVLCYVVHKVYGVTQEKTGEILGRHHATARHLAKKISGYIEFNKDYERTISQIINSVR